MKGAVRGARRAWLPIAVAMVLAGCGSTVGGVGTSQASGVGDGTGSGVSAGSPSAMPNPLATGQAAGVLQMTTSTSGAGAAGPQTSVGTSGVVAGSTTYGAIPLSGRGWDRNFIYIGETTQKDVQTVAQSFGVNSVDTGDQQADTEAIINTFNAKGGLFGRKLKGNYFDIKTTGNAETQAQAACTHFTQDRPVVAVFQAALASDTPSFRSCMAKAQVPVIAGGGQAFDDQVFSELKGYYTLAPFPSWNPFAPTLAKRLEAQSYFTPWDTTNGAKGVAPVKVGFFCPDTPIGRRVGGLVAKAFAAVGHAPSDYYYYGNGEGEASSAALKFKSSGVTHIVACDLPLFVLMTAAESQHYRPRYAISTFNTPALFLEGVSPAAQLAGSVGVGWAPTLDVASARDPGSLPAAKRCAADAKKYGVSYPPQRRFAQAFLYDSCDIIGLIVASMRQVGALTGPAIRDGLGIVGGRFDLALSFASMLSPTQHGVPGAVRDISYEGTCSCYKYRDAITRIGA